jgi:NADH-quinone oxidoreductase subunit G
MKFQKNYSSNKPMIILGESLLNLKSSKYFFNKIKEFLVSNNKINDDWNSFNILSSDAATVGNFDLGLVNEQ